MLCSNGLSGKPLGDRILQNTTDSHQHCFAPLASQGTRRATEYCKTQLIRAKLALLQWPLREPAGRQNTAKHNLFAPKLLCSNGLSGNLPGDRILPNTIDSHQSCFDPMASQGTHMGPYAPRISPHGSIWAHVGSYRLIWTHMGSIRAHADLIWGPQRSIWAHMDPYGPIWATTAPYAPIWAHMGPYGPPLAPVLNHPVLNSP